LLVTIPEEPTRLCGCACFLVDCFFLFGLSALSLFGFAPRLGSSSTMMPLNS